MSRTESRTLWLIRKTDAAVCSNALLKTLNMLEQRGLVILVSDVIGSFVNKGAVVHTDKEPDWQVNEEEEEEERQREGWRQLA